MPTIRKWQRVTLSTGAYVGEPGDLPPQLVGLDESTLANLPAAFGPATLEPLGLLDTGFLQVDVEVPPPRVTIMSRYEFMQRFTPQERQAIREAAKTDATVADFIDLFDKVGQVHLDVANTIGGMDYLVTQNIITAERSVAILG